MSNKYQIKDDISPCIAKDRVTGVGVPLVPGGVLDFDIIGIDAEQFLAQHAWAFVLDEPAKRGRPRKKVEAATAAPGEERDES